MLALAAAAGSFHVKSPRTKFVMVFVMVRVLPSFMTVSFFCSVTLFTSTLGARSYSDQRYSSMQASVTAHSSGVPSRRMVGLGCSSIGSDVDTDASRTRTSGGDGAEGTKGVSETDASVAGATVSPRSGSGVAALLTVVTEGSVV